MKVVQIGKYYYPEKGGVESHLLEVCRQLKDRVDIQVSVAHTCNKTISEIVDGVSVKRYRSFGNLQSVSICPTFYKAFQQNADIWHFHFPNPLAVAAYLAVRPKGKVVVSWHSDIVRQKLALKFYRPVLKYFLENHVDRIFAATPNHIKYSEFLCRIPEKCAVIPYGIDVSEFEKPDLDEVQKIRDKFKKPIVLFVGRLVYYKGVEYLVRAMKDIDAALIIIGNGPLMEKIDNLTRELDMYERVFIYYQVEKLLNIYHAADIFVLPSVEPSEAFGIVQIEAMACGRPVISTNLKSGVPWVNRDGESGIIVEPADEKALARAVKNLLADDEKRGLLGDKAKKRAFNEFSASKMADTIMDEYHRLLA